MSRLKGSKLSKDHKIKIGKANKIALKGYHPVNEFKKGNKMRFKTGKNHPNWKGGITPLVILIRRCFKYRQWRSDIFTRDDFTCQECGDSRGGNLEAHHINPFAEIIHRNKIKTLEEALACEELWNINNGQTLCEKCHDKKKLY